MAFRVRINKFNNTYNPPVIFTAPAYLYAANKGDGNASNVYYLTSDNNKFEKIGGKLIAKYTNGIWYNINGSFITLSTVKSLMSSVYVYVE